MPLKRLGRTHRTTETPAVTRRGVRASAQRVNLKGRTINIGKPTEWQAENAGYFDLVGEVKQLTWLQGNVMAKCRWFVGVRNLDDPEAPPIPVTDDDAGIDATYAARAQAELARLKGPLGGISEIARSFNMNFDITGEVNLVGRAARVIPAKDDEPEQAIAEEWSACSVFEIKSEGSGRGRSVTLFAAQGDGEGEKLDLANDAVIRIWQHHPLWKQQADCALRGAVGELETLVALRNQVKATARSYLPAGFLTIPNELSFGPANPTEGEDGEEAGTDPFEQELIEAMIEPIEDPGAASAYAFTPIRGPAEYLTEQYLRRIEVARSDDPSVPGKIEGCVRAVARALNAPVEKVLGSQSTTFANAAVIKQDEFDEHLEPRCVLIADALTVGFLHPNLLDTAPNPDGTPTQEAVPQEVVDRLCVWYDPSAMIAQPDIAEKADKGLEEGALSWEAWRRYSGASEDDAPTDEELLFRAQLKAQRMPPAVSTAVEQPLAEPVTASAHPKASHAGRRLMLIDREFRSKLQTAASAALTRVLERAGAKLRSATTQNAQLAKGLVAVNVAKCLGPTLVAAAGINDDDLIADGWTGLEREFMTWGASAQSQAIEVVNSLIGLSGAERDALQLRQAADLGEAWSWMRDALHDLAKARLYDPDPLAPALGEFDPTSKVPTGLVREALARAGGASGLTVQGSDPFVVLNNGNPTGGVAQGELVMTTLTGADVLIEGYEWVYGPAFRQSPFEPHLDLDEVQFTDWDSDVLSGSILDDANYFPGDHQNCACDAVAVLVLPADLEEGE